MPKYDAFGREIGEDTLQGLGGSAPEEAEPERTPRPEFVAPAVTVRRSGSARGCFIAIVVVLLIGGVGILGVVSLVSSVDLGDIGTEDTVQAPDGPQPKGLGAGSLARPAELGAALATIKAEGGGRLTNLRVAPERVDATLLTRAGRLRHVQVQPGGDLERFGGDSGPGFDTVPTLPFAKLRPGAVQRLARRGAEELGVPVSQLQYAVPSSHAGSITWAVYFTRGRYVLGDGRGRFQRRYP